MSTPSSILVFNTYKYTRLQIEQVLYESFHISEQPESIINCLEHKFLLYWTGEHLLKQMEHGIIKRDCVEYQVHYYMGLTRGKIIRELQYVKDNNIAPEQYALSFRKARPEFSLPPVVLIKTSRRI